MTLTRLTAQLSRRANRAVEDAEGITLSQMTALGQVRALRGEARMVDLAGRLQLTKAAITKIVDALQAAGCVERARADNDRRVVFVRLTGEGERLLQRAEAAFEGVLFEGLWDHLTTEQTGEAARILAHADEALEREGPALPPG